MEEASQNSKNTKKYIGKFIFRENNIFGMPTGSYKNIGFYKEGSDFISIRLEESLSSAKSKKLRLFSCFYKMIRGYHYSLN